jgi:hypothetical protein
MAMERGLRNISRRPAVPAPPAATAGTSLLQFNFNGPKRFLAIDGCELTRAKCRKTIL